MAGGAGGYANTEIGKTTAAAFLDAYAKHQEGDDTKLKAWTNTTRGETWEGEVERTDPVRRR